MNFIDGIFFFYSFIGLYFLVFFIILYIKNKDRVFDYPEGKPVPVSVIMPCYNEADSVGESIKSILELDYPKNMIEIIVVDDKSKDRSVEVINEYVKKYENVRLIVNKRNSGGAAEPTNIGIKNAKYDYVAVVDADSYPRKDALVKMIGFLQNEDDVAAVTCSVLSKHPKNFMQKIQAIEYTIIAWTRKLLDLVDSVYVTPGPFALYKKDKLAEVGFFDTKNLTQDIEIVWRLLSKGYKARMCLATGVYSETPGRFRAWWRQRTRWVIGGNQTLWKYKHLIFRKGMLGAFIIPFFAFSLFLGLFGLGIFVYLFARNFLVSFLTTRYSIYGETALLSLQELSFSPSVLNFFGAVLLLFGLIFSFFGLFVMRDLKLGKDKVFNILFYMIVYLTLLPLIQVWALYKIARGRYSW